MAVNGLAHSIIQLAEVASPAVSSAGWATCSLLVKVPIILGGEAHPTVSGRPCRVTEKFQRFWRVKSVAISGSRNLDIDLGTKGVMLPFAASALWSRNSTRMHRPARCSDIPSTHTS